MHVGLRPFSCIKVIMLNNYYHTYNFKINELILKNKLPKMIN